MGASSITLGDSGTLAIQAPLEIRAPLEIDRQMFRPLLVHRLVVGGQ
jgi:hypothetical protein